MRTAVIVSLSLLLSGCTFIKDSFLPTPYQAQDSLGYGYANKQLNSTTFQVSFAGNYNTSKQQVQNYLIYYMADLTLSHGYQYYGNTAIKVHTTTYSQYVLDSSCVVTQPGDSNWAYCTCTEPQPSFLEQVLLDDQPDTGVCESFWYDPDNKQSYDLRSVKQNSYEYTATSTLSVSHTKSAATGNNAATVKASLANSIGQAASS